MIDWLADERRLDTLADRLSEKQALPLTPKKLAKQKRRRLAVATQCVRRVVVAVACFQLPSPFSTQKRSNTRALLRNIKNLFVAKFMSSKIVCMPNISTGNKKKTFDCARGNQNAMASRSAPFRTLTFVRQTVCLWGTRARESACMQSSSQMAHISSVRSSPSKGNKQLNAQHRKNNNKKARARR